MDANRLHRVLKALTQPTLVVIDEVGYLAQDGVQASLADTELQLITGHARRETLAVYQHVALDGDLEGKYQQAMKLVDL